MALSTCPEDVLFNIASYLHSNSPPSVYCTDLDSRVRIFGRLVLVCRRFYEVFTRLLYRSLCFTYEFNTWPEEHESLWFRQNPRRRGMAALYRIISAAPALGKYTQFLELRWEDHGGPSENLSNFLSKFPDLREVDIFTSVVPCPNGDVWIPNIVHGNSFKYLRTLRMNLPIFPASLSKIFYLPHLEDLELVCFDPAEEDLWPLVQEVDRGRSKVTHLSLTADLGSFDLLEILSWPHSLTSLTFISQGYSICLPDRPSATCFDAVLQEFRHTLTTLNIQISDTFFALEPEDAHDDHLFPILETSLFHSLQELRAPSFLFTGPPGSHYSRENIHTHLPSSLRTLEVTFTSKDLFLFYGWYTWIHRFGHSHTEKYNWLISLGRECSPLGRLPLLERVVVRDEGFTHPWPIPNNLQLAFYGSSISLDIRPRVPREIDYEHDDIRYDPYSGYSPSYSGLDRREFAEVDGDPLFGDEQNVYSDSRHGSEDEDEDAADEELLSDEEWEQFDNEMAVERAKRGQEWRRGQWPPYEETKSLRELVPRNSLLGSLFGFTVG